MGLIGWASRGDHTRVRRHGECLVCGKRPDPWLEQGVRDTFLGLLYDLVVDFSDGMATLPIHAETPEQAFRAGQELFPGQRVVVVLRQSEFSTDAD